MTTAVLVPTRMPDCFISFGSQDRPFAESVKQVLEQHGLDVFLAPLSLLPGEPWSQGILNALRHSKWVLLLASRSACASPYVQQEIGGAVVTNKPLVPVVWDMPAKELPAWANQPQAVDLAGMDSSAVASAINRLGERIRQDRNRTRLIGLALLCAGIYFACKE